MHEHVHGESRIWRVTNPDHDDREQSGKLSPADNCATESGVPAKSDETGRACAGADPVDLMKDRKLKEIVDRAS